MRRLLGHRDARIYIGGQTLSVTGDSALWLAMAIWVKILTGSNSAAGLTFFAFICGVLVSPVSGVVADRVRRRPLLIVANLGAAALVCALLLVHGRGQVWLIYAVMFGYGAANSLITSAQNALLPALVPPDLLGDANAALQMASQGLRVISPLLGAGLLAWAGARPVILLDAGTFAAAAGTVAVLRLRELRPARGPVGRRGGRGWRNWRNWRNWQDEFGAGIRHIARTPSLRQPLIACLIAVTAFGLFETVPFAVVGQGLHRSPAFLGVLTSLQGTGALAGGALAAPVMRRTSERALIADGLAACAAASLLLITASLPVVCAASAALGLGIVWVNVGAITLIQRRTPAALLGRVDAALEFAIVVPQAASIALGAALIAVVNYRILLLAMGAVIGSSAGYLASRRGQADDVQDGGEIAAIGLQRADSMPR
jgi:Major Facilitator Superfamily